MEKSGKLKNLWVRAKRVWFRWAEVNQHAAWFPFFIAVVVGLDAIIVVLPGDVIVVLAVLSNPLAWRRTALAAGLGGAIGAFLLYLIVRETGGDFLDRIQALNEALGTGTRWAESREFFKHYGLASLAFGSVLPLLSWPPVVLAGLASSAALPVAAYLILGRLARYVLLCAGLRYGWTLFHKMRHEAHKEREDSLRD